MVRFIKYGFARAGKVKGQTPKVEENPSKGKKNSRSKYRSKFNKQQHGQLKSNRELNQIRGINEFLVSIFHSILTFFSYCSKFLLIPLEKKADEAEALLSSQIEKLPKKEADQKRQEISHLFGFSYGKLGWRRVGLRRKRLGSIIFPHFSSLIIQIFLHLHFRQNLT